MQSSAIYSYIIIFLSTFGLVKIYPRHGMELMFWDAFKEQSAKGKLQQGPHTEVRQAWGFGNIANWKTMYSFLEIPRENQVLQDIQTSVL